MAFHDCRAVTIFQNASWVSMLCPNKAKWKENVFCLIRMQKVSLGKNGSDPSVHEANLSFGWTWEITVAGESGQLCFPFSRTVNKSGRWCIRVHSGESSLAEQSKDSLLCLVLSRKVSLNFCRLIVTLYESHVYVVRQLFQTIPFIMLERQFNAVVNE